MSGVAFKGLRFQDEIAEHSWTNLLRAEKAIPDSLLRQLERIIHSTSPITDHKMEDNLELSRLLATAQFHTHLTALLSTLPA